MSAPLLPPIKSHNHRLNVQKALDQVNKNYLACQDTGATSDAYKTNSKSFENIKILKTSTTGRLYSKAKEDFLSNEFRDSKEKLNFKFNSIDEYRKKINPFVVDIEDILRAESELLVQKSEDDSQFDRAHTPKKSSTLLWEDLQFSEKLDPTDPISHIIRQRNKFGWNTKLPLHGAGAKQAIIEYVDRTDTETKKTLNDDGEYVIAVCLSDIIQNIVYSPYTLRRISYDESKNFDVYYIITASCVSRVDVKSYELEIRNSMKWIWEKRLFDMLRRIKIFKLFRVWKNFRTWQTTIRGYKKTRSKEFLARTLFSANEVFQRVLLHVRDLCERASSSKTGLGEANHRIIMIKYDSALTHTLEDFRKIQTAQIEQAFEKLKLIQQEVIDLAYVSCTTVGQLEGIDFDAFFDVDSFTHQETFIDNYLKHRQTKTTRLRDTSLITPPKKGKGPGYAIRKEWRYVLQRICQFLRMLDYLIQELLHRVVKTSVRLLKDYVTKSTGFRKRPDSPISKDLSRRSIASLDMNDSYESFEYDFNSISINKIPLVDLKNIKTNKDIDQLLEEIRLKTTIERIVEPIFITDLLLNVKKSDNYDESDEEEDEDDRPSSRQDDPFDERKPRAKKKFLSVSVSLSPDQSEFKNFFKDLISEYEETAGRIQTLLHEPKFELFYQVPVYELTRVEREMRLSMNFDDEIKRPWPEVEFLFGEDEEYQDMVSEIMKSVTTSLSSVTSFANTYDEYCQMVISTIKLKIDKTIHKQSFSPDDFYVLLTKHTEQINQIDSMITQKRVCFFDFRSHRFQKDCRPFPNKVITIIDSFLPQMAVKRNEKLQETMRDALKMLDRDPTSVEEFVEHLSILTKINNELPSLEKEFLTVTRLFTIANDFNLSITPEQYAFYKTLGSTFHHLKTSLLYTEAQCEENIRKFTIDLGLLIGRVHNESIDLRVRLQSPVLLSSDTTPQVARENLTLFQEMIEKLVEKAKNYAAYQERFGNTMKQVKKKTATDYTIQDYGRSGVSIMTLQTELNELEHDIGLRRLLWKSIEEWDLLVREWLNKLLDEIKVDLVQKDVNRFTQNIYMLEKGLPHNDLVPKLKDKVLDFKKALPIIIALRNPSLKPRHYAQLKHLIGHDLMNDNQKITMSVLLDADVLQYRERISDISALASNEATLEGMLNRIIDIWKKTDFRLVKDHGKDTFVITGTDEIQILLEESQVTMSTIKSSSYVGPIKNLVEDWDRRLTLFSKTLDEWIICQKRWLYLKQIFSTADIQRQLVNETKIFNQIEKFWKDLMRRTDDKPNALRAATAPGLFEALQSYAVQMEKIQRSLEDYFETKRLIFPRLYFLSNEDLLDILSQSKDPSKIQLHLNKCFGNINGLEISEKFYEITHLISFENEKLELLKSVRIRGAAEQWLGALENGMYDSIKKHLKTGLTEYASLNYRDWVQRQPGQVVLLVSQINFNKQILKCLNSSTQHESLINYRDELINSINIAASLMSKDLPSHKLLTIEALLVIEVHSRDTLSDLIEDKVYKVDDFEWRRQLRYEWDELAHNCNVLQSDSSFVYGFEYLGCSPRLVITPLTDRCYLTLTGALKLNLGGAPAGPAGTGKTETVKDLAKSVGKLCLVFNCSEGLDYKMLGKFFSGLSQSGSWCCFDEFNRIDIEVLSVVAQQMLTIKTAKDAQVARFNFEGREIKLNNTCGFFITMNPTYAGRVELPDNLKPLFRPVAMMVPDLALIAQIILFSVGFTSAEILATKIVTLYHLASRQLSQQDHYDFGLRTIKAVLLMAGQVKKNFVNENTIENNTLTKDQESQVLMQALYDTNLPKFLKEDSVLFGNLMNDLFPDLSKLNKNQDAIEKSIHSAIRELNYQYWPSQCDKIIQLYDQISVRHGIMLVGPPGGGKTVSRNILQRALSNLPSFLPDKNPERTQKSTVNILQRSKKARIEHFIINPKSISIGELYGTTDPSTLEWSDGVFGNVIRTFSNSTSAIDPESDNFPLWQFVILDGPVDTFWVENLNTVLDDSKVLCLSNGERINMTPSMRVIFEVDSLVHTSPATVSRCAMVYFDPSDLGLTPFIKNWFNSLPKSFPHYAVDLINELLDFSLPKGFSFIEKRKGCTSFPFQKQNVLNCMFAIMGQILEFFEKNGGFSEIESQIPEQKKSAKKRSKPKTDGDPDSGYIQAETVVQKQYFLQRNPKLLQPLIIKVYIFSYIWGFGGLLRREDNAEDDNIINQKSHVKSNLDSLTHEFDEFVRETFEHNIKYGIYLPPNTKPVFDFFLDVTSGNFVEWSKLLPNVDTVIKQTKPDDLIETLDSIRFSFLATLLLMGKHTVLITGSSGIGKTVTIQSMLKKLSTNGYSFKLGTILGDVFNYAEKTKANISNNVNSIFNEEDGLKKGKSEYNVLTNGIQFSAQTSSNKFLSMLLSKLSKKGQNILGAPKNKCIVMFIDDLNIPIADRFGDQAPLELLRYINENNGFYDVKNSTYKTITDVSFVMCCDPPNSSRSSISQRLLRHCCIVSMPDPSARSLFNIYQVHLGRFFAENEFNIDIKSSLLPIVSCSIVMYYRIFLNMLPTPTKSHYIFNLRDLSKLVKGLMQANSSIITTKEHLVDLFSHECLRVFNDRLITREDNEQFYFHLSETVVDYFKLTIKNPFASQKYMKNSYSDALSSRSHDTVSSEDEFTSSFIIYADFIKNDERIYQPLNNWKQLVSVLSDYQMRSNMTGHGTKQIVFFKEAVEHICRACRVLRQPSGHMLLIGIDGTGKNTIMELAAYISNCELFKLNIKKGYNYEDFRDDLKHVFKMTGVFKKRMVFFIADKDIYEEIFLEDLDSLLTSGNIPDLFDNEELDNLFLEVKNDAMLEQIVDEKSEMYKFLIKRVQNNLHLVLSMSPVGSKFRERCRFHPAIINCTTIDWYNDWSESAMKQVSMSFMESIEFSIGSNMSFEDQEEVKAKISRACVHIHMSLIKSSQNFFNEHKRYYYVTPSCYIDLLKTFSKIFETKKTEYLDNLTRLQNGLEKLSDANELVSLMREELVTLGPQIEQKSIETETLLEKLKKDQEAVNEVADIVGKEKEKMRIETEMVSEYAQEAEKDLADVKPLLALAKESLNALNKADISELRVYNSPPFLVMTVMSAVCVILNRKPDWNTAKQLLAESSFITRLVNFDAETVTEKTYLKFKQYSKNPDFRPDMVGRVSKACESMCSWVLAVEKFHEVYRTVKPKEDKVKEANEALEIMRSGLAKKEMMLEKIEKHLEGFRKKYSESLAEKKALEDRKELMKSRMERAVELTAALDTEKVRWTKQYEELQHEADLIIGVCLVSAGAVNYLGAMTQDYRAKLLVNWVRFCNEEINLKVDPNFDLTKNVVSNHVIRNWINQKLPDDKYSIENAIFMNYSLKWPLIIDPQNQVARWIKHKEGLSLKICKADDPLLFRTLEQAIRLGQPVLIENIAEFIDPVLDPILHKQILVRGAQRVLRLGENEVEYNDSFRLYLVTSLPNPHYLPSAFIKVNLINFTITFKCLFEQFLSLVVLKERPELEKERTNLLDSIAKDFTLLRELEDKSLTILSRADTSSINAAKSLETKTLLDDQYLIDVLKQTKITSQDISNRLKRNEETEKNLNLARQRYSAIAIRASILYFSIQNLVQLNIMYQFSLAWFYTIFQSCLGGTVLTEKQESKILIGESALNVTELAPGLSGTLRPNNLIKDRSSVSSSNEYQEIRKFSSEQEFQAYIDSVLLLLTKTVYKVVSWALFAEHQLIFSFSLSVNILKHEDCQSKEKIALKEYNYFLNSSLLADMEQDSLEIKIKNLNDVKFCTDLLIDEKTLRQILLLEDILPDNFKLLTLNLRDNCDKFWANFINCKDPYNLMSQNESSFYFNFKLLTKFQKLILIKLLRRDTLIQAIKMFVSEILGPNFLSSGVPTLHDLYNQSFSHSPIIFVLSAGSDPTNQLLRYAKESRGSTLHMDIVSLGQGQGPKAEELINKSLMLKGRWIFLQNCHLAASFMPRLSAIVNNFTRPGAEVDKHFRLFLSSKPNASFPISLLKSGIKMTIESPAGLKNNLKQNFGTGGYVSKRIVESNDFGPHWRRLLFSLGFIHALIHERKKFGPLGWNLPYEFNNSDLEVAILQLQSVLSINREHAPFNVLKYVTGEVIYGGRVTDDFDRRCLLSVLSKFFCEQAVQDVYYYGADQTYQAPSKQIDHTSLISFIDNLPDEDDPSIFGMNEYAEKMLRATQGEFLISSILSMEPLQTASSRIDESKNDNDIVLKICSEITSTLPAKIEPNFTGFKGKHITFEEALEKLKDKLGDTYYENSAMNTILRQEIQRYNKLLSVILKSITELTKAIRGEIMISKKSESIYNSFLLQKVPQAWDVYAYPSLKPLASWIKNLFKRTQFFSYWKRNMVLYAEDLIENRDPYSLWISGFFYPQGLLAAISQNYARKYHTSIDSIEFKYDVKNEIYDESGTSIECLFDSQETRFKLNDDVDGILLHGFFIDGGKWDRENETLLDSPLRFTPLPHFLCKLTKKNENNDETETNKDTEQKNKYKCPVYRNSVRAGNSTDQAKNYVTSIDLDCKEDPEFWILRGVCMILQNDD